MPQPKVTAPTLLKYFLCRFTDAIRIEFTVGTVTHSAELNASGHVTHASHEVPECLRLAARDCLDAGLYQDIPGCEYQGVESQDEMFHAVACRCMCCGVVQESMEDLDNDHGECGKCSSDRMAEDERRDDASPYDVYGLRGLVEAC
jgi:hypothetical protein